MSIKYEKKKKNRLGSITYGSGSRKKNRGSGNRGGCGKGGIWDHKKGLVLKLKKEEKIKRIKIRKKERRKEIDPRFLSSLKYRLRMEKRNIFIRGVQIQVPPFSRISNRKFLEKIGYIIVDKR